MPTTPVTPEAAIVDQAVEAALDAAAERVARWGRHACGATELEPNGETLDEYRRRVI